MAEATTGIDLEHPQCCSDHDALCPLGDGKAHAAHHYSYNWGHFMLLLLIIC
jgi:hypothetical protein